MKARCIAQLLRNESLSMMTGLSFTAASGNDEPQSVEPPALLTSFEFELKRQVTWHAVSLFR